MITSDQYQAAVSRLSPQGLIWPSIAEDSELGKLWGVIGDALMSAANDADSVRYEMFPDVVGSFSDQWSKIIGFPRFGFENLSASEQRNANLAWLNVNELSNGQFFVDIAAILGYEIIVDDRNTDPTLGPFEFLVTTSADLPTIIFQTSLSTTGESLVDTGKDGPLESLIEFFAPAHTTPSFFYASNLIAEDGDNLISETGDNLIG